MVLFLVDTLAYSGHPRVIDVRHAAFLRTVLD